MKILAVEGSASVASVALMEDGKVLSEITTDNGLTHSETLMKYVDMALELAGMKAGEVDYIAVSKGPGSFTGLRIAGALVKGLALSLDKKVIPVSTLEAMAVDMGTEGDYVCVTMDARRDNVYTGVYKAVSLEPVLDECCISRTELREKIACLSGRVVMAGDEGGVSGMARASKVAKLAYLRVLESGSIAVTADDLVLNYLKESSAKPNYKELV